MKISVRSGQRPGLLGHALDQSRHKCRPTSLMARAKTLARVAVAILVKPHEFAPMWIIYKSGLHPQGGPAPATVGQEQGNEAPSQLLRDLGKIQPPAAPGGKFHR